MMQPHNMPIRADWQPGLVAPFGRTIELQFFGQFGSLYGFYHKQWNPQQWKSCITPSSLTLYGP